MKDSKIYITSVFLLAFSTSTFAQTGGGSGGSGDGGSSGGTLKNAAYWTVDYLMNLAQRQQTDKLYEEYLKVYNTLKDGYLVVRTLTDKNKNLHEKFFESLGTVSPIVKEYYKVVLITKTYSHMVGGVEDALSVYQQSEVFTEQEIIYMGKVYEGMLARVKDNTQELLKVLTDKELQMMDSERITTIDRIYEDTNTIYADLKKFNQMNLFRAKNRGLNDSGAFKKLYNLALK